MFPSFNRNVLKKDFKDRIKKMNYQGFSSFLDHMLTHNMCYISNQPIAKCVFEKYEKIYKAHQGRDLDRMATRNDYLKQLMNKLYRSLEDKNKEINKLKVAKANLDHQIIEKDKEITHVGQRLTPIRMKLEMLRRGQSLPRRS